ncbi:hypothetical protein ACFCZV_35425 [Streptomyces hydrogenans]|uniref:hypothetical protein n=1 Tax=Streptomyces hydrogenans TaxID=1873719 RepID=UPI0035D58E9C
MTTYHDPMIHQPQSLKALPSLLRGVDQLRHEQSRQGAPRPHEFDPVGWPGDGEQDKELFLVLYYASLLDNAPESRTQAFARSQDGGAGPPYEHLEGALGPRDAGLLHRDADAFRDNRPTYCIAEPLIGFYRAIMRPLCD